MLLVVQTLEVILQCCPKEAAALLKPAMAKLLASILGNQEPGLVQASECTCRCCMQYQLRLEALPCFWPPSECPGARPGTSKYALRASAATSDELSLQAQHTTPQLFSPCAMSLLLPAERRPGLPKLTPESMVSLLC